MYLSQLPYDNHSILKIAKLLSNSSHRGLSCVTVTTSSELTPFLPANRYHMQLSAHNQPIHGTKSPPAPLVQTSVSTGHSRNVSQGGSSTTSAAVVVTAAAAAAAGSAEPAAADGSVAQ